MEKFNLGMLEYEGIREELVKYAVSYEGRQRLSQLSPMDELRKIERAIEETAEAYALLGKGSSVPLPSLDGIELAMSLMCTGYLFTEQNLSAVQGFLHSCGQLKKYMASKGELVDRIGYYAIALEDLPGLQQEILRCIHHGVISDQASHELEKVRRKIRIIKDKIQKKIQSIMSRHAAILQENIVSVRGGRYVIPVKKEYYKQVNGHVLDQSTSGQTVFIEPHDISSLQSELDALHGDEATEEAKILGYLTELVEREANVLHANIDITGTYDFIFAKAKYGAAIGGVGVKLSHNGITKISGAKHPLLLQSMVPLDLEVGDSYKSLVITGPNTGGKTVVLKTFGLLALMVQSGLLVPVNPGSQFAVYSGIMAVIGDGQNLEQSLSTFSAQIQSLVHMLNVASPSTLLLIDELAAGTDPSEGIALSIAILEEFNSKSATVMVTTHYNELKTFASKAPGFQNARMEFHTETLRPLYSLTIGEAGQSYAIEIAKKLGISKSIVERSQDIVARQTRGEKKLNLWDGETVDPSLVGTSTNSNLISQGSVEKVKKPVELFEVGDSVFVTSFRKFGIVSAGEDSMGMVEVMIQKRKVKVNKKRIKPHIKKEELYPDDYDMDIVFDSKENRKKRKLMGKRHMEGLEIIRRPNED